MVEIRVSNQSAKEFLRYVSQEVLLWTATYEYLEADSVHSNLVVKPCDDVREAIRYVAYYRTLLREIEKQYEKYK